MDRQWIQKDFMVTSLLVSWSVKIGHCFGIASAGRTEDSLDDAFLKKYCGGKTLNEYLKSI